MKLTLVFKVIISFFFISQVSNASDEVSEKQVQQLVDVITSLSKAQKFCPTNKVLINILPDLESSQGENEFSSCDDLKIKFKDNIDKKISGSIENLETVQGCLRSNICPKELQDNTKLQENFNRYRGLQKKIHRYALGKWVNEQPRDIQSCFKGPTTEVSLSANIRVPQLTKNNSFCQSQARQWTQNASFQIQVLLDSKNNQLMEEDDFAFFNSFKYSPAGRLMYPNVLYKQDKPLTEREARISQYNSNKKVIQSLTSLSERIKKLEGNQLYQIFGFKDELVSFLESKSSEDQKLALSCQKKSGFVYDCIKSLNKVCKSRLWNLGKNTLPIVSFFTALDQSKDLLAIESLGLLSEDELKSKKTLLLTQGLFGFNTGGVLGRGLVKASARRNSLQFLNKKVSSSQLTKLSNIQGRFKLSPKQIKKIVKRSKDLNRTIAQLEKVGRNEALNVDEAIELGRVLFKSNIQQIITTHSTRSQNLNGILEAGLRSSHPTQKNFAMAMPTNRSTVAQALAGGKYGDSTLFFQGSAAQLFDLHKTTGLATFTKRLQRIETSERGVIEILKYKRVGKDIVITEAKLHKNSTPLSDKQKSFWVLTDGVMSMTPVYTVDSYLIYKRHFED